LTTITIIVDQIRDIFGFDPAQPEGERNELLGRWPG
jgi:hypothetical protein